MAAENGEWMSRCPSSAECVPRIPEIQSVFQWCGLPKVKDYLSKGELTNSISVLSWRGKDQVGLRYHFWGCHDTMSGVKRPALLPSVGISKKQVGEGCGGWVSMVAPASSARSGCCPFSRGHFFWWWPEASGGEWEGDMGGCNGEFGSLPRDVQVWEPLKWNCGAVLWGT